ncbi:2-dehydropantoate 2-reductase [Oceanivirga salmonicida]|uniref:2-dehydropantoate 2-reductase n=1 Tax=Oceanivirga salmonicida TaxID=1769291 RepID=UPI000835B984|nr:2-dehydropantoate 2-reductase [Oceanivirga salmonicida]
MEIVIAGAGAMGATYGAMLKKSGNNVIFLDEWQDNVDTINNSGVKFINLSKEEKLEIKAYKPVEYKKIPDLIIVFTKSMQLDNMLTNIKHLFGENTKVLCLLNGLGHIETLKKYVEPKNILIGVTVLTAQMKKAGVFEVTSYGNTEIQNITKDGEKSAKEIVTTINNTGLPCIYSKDIIYSIWRKACINGTMNACCALLDCNMIELGKSPNLEKILRTIVEEFSMVAKYEGVNIDIDEITELVCWFTTPEFKGSSHYPSMHQDLIKNNRYTEIDYLNGYVAKKAKENGDNAKFCELITLLVHSKEQILGAK